ncbi:hypothetical protein BDV96DRAFT_3437 [Lophiotrema nucula]|uniref:Transcription factor domain-containing protein n=1 Tax=Lophiotrema nucula TaxID=690887 RepID=A0A6A5ZT02_9PLEO|nr:hypothetical protein BDV96DRAFT_3437 [Lophiotrema nucula]
MLKVINRPSYRSILALYLFSQIPIPVGLSEDEELDGISGIVCLQTALLHIQQLRGRKKNRTAGSAPPAHLTQAFLDLENRAYWAAVVWDTSNAMMLNLRTTLTSGLRGACAEPAWRLTSGFLVGSFQPKVEQWLKDGVEITDQVASEIIAAAGVSKIYIWKNIASIKEAMREGLDEDTVLPVWGNVLAALDIYKTSFTPLLNACERKLHFLSQVNRLNWYQVSLHYHLGILVLVEALEAAQRIDLLPDISEQAQDSEQESFNVLKFGLDNAYTLYGPGQGPPATSPNLGNAVDPSRQQFAISLVSIDPNPRYVADAVLLMDKTVGRQYKEGNIKVETYSYLASILRSALETLPQSSKYVQAARHRLKDTNTISSP